MACPRQRECIAIARVLIAAILSASILTTPLYSAPSAPFGSVVYADRAHVGNAFTSVGATVFSGDRLSTESTGSIQIRAGAARLLLASETSAMLALDDASPAARLTKGTATFSTAGANAFALHVSTAVIRPATDQATIGKVTVLSNKELVVKSVRGSLNIGVEDDVREIQEGMAYRIVLDPNAPPPQGPRGAGGKGMGAPPIKAAKSKFIWYVIIATGVVTTWLLHEAFESDDRP